MIAGIGADIVEIARMQRALHRHGQRLAQKILHPQEFQDWAMQSTESHQARFLAKRFAAKEAIAKALHTGIRPPAVFSAMNIIHTPLGAPLLQAEPALASWLLERGVGLHLSIADEQTHVVAFAVAETIPASHSNRS